MSDYDEYPGYTDVFVDGYNSWLIEAQSTEVVRWGFAMGGCYPYREDAHIVYDRSESDCEHCARVESLLFWILASDIQPFRQRASDLLLVPLAGKLHDKAERYCGGDIPQDGSRDDITQDAKEFKTLRDKVLVTYPLPMRVELELILREFISKSGPRGQLIYCADKTDAILRGLYYEQLDKTGYITKKGSSTEQDRHLMSVCNREEIVDNYLVHFLETSEDFRDIREPFLKLIKIACGRTSRIRNERELWFPWWKSYFEQKGIVLQII